MFLGFHSNTAQASCGLLMDISRCFATLHRPCCARLTWPPWQITGKCSSRKTMNGNMLGLDLWWKRPCCNNCTGNTSLFLGFVQKQTALFKFLFPNKIVFKLEQKLKQSSLFPNDQMPTQDEIVPLETTIDVKYVICRTDPWSLILIYEKDHQRWLSAYKLAPLVFWDKEDEDRDRLPSWHIKFFLKNRCLFVFFCLTNIFFLSGICWASARTYVWFEFLPESPEKDFLRNLGQNWYVDAKERTLKLI